MVRRPSSCWTDTTPWPATGPRTTTVPPRPRAPVVRWRRRGPRPGGPARTGPRAPRTAPRPRRRPGGSQRPARTRWRTLLSDAPGTLCPVGHRVGRASAGGAGGCSGEVRPPRRGRCSDGRRHAIPAHPTAPPWPSGPTTASRAAAVAARRARTLGAGGRSAEPPSDLWTAAHDGDNPARMADAARRPPAVARTLDMHLAACGVTSRARVTDTTRPVRGGAGTAAGRSRPDGSGPPTRRQGGAAGRRAATNRARPLRRSRPSERCHRRWPSSP